MLDLLHDIVLLKDVNDAKVQDNRQALRGQRALNQVLGGGQHTPRDGYCRHILPEVRICFAIKVIVVIIVIFAAVRL